MYFSKVLKMIKTMDDLCQEDVELNQNMHGIVVEEKGKEIEEQVNLETASSSEMIYEVYFETIMRRTLEMRAAKLAQFQPANQGQLKTGMAGLSSLPPEA